MMKFDDQKIKEILLREDFVTPQDIAQAEQYAASHHVSLAEYLITKNILTKDLLGQAIAESLNVSFFNLARQQPSRELAVKLPESTAKHHHAILVSEAKGRVVVATDDPSQPGLRTALKKIFRRKRITLAFAFSEDLEASFVHYRKPLDTRFVQIIHEQRRLAPEIIDEILSDALAHRASDIHIEPQEHDVLVRFRIDGVLHDAGKLPKQHYENIVNRIKIQSHLRIDEHFAAQDGSMRFVHDKTTVDIRVSVVPTFDGEKIALRLLSEYVRSFTLADLGLSNRHEDILTKAAEKPFGMILVTGPTGSGKTTTLYALLKLLNDPEVNITTVEDPIEYKIAGINQIQVNPNTNLTFAHGLRSIIRQDPDIILVGEIRDRETAEIAVNAALTGHLLLSTFHANDASTAIPRLLEMGVEPFLTASTIELIVAQRLVRTICSVCRVSTSNSAATIKRRFPKLAPFFRGTSITLYRGKGCSNCSGTGYKGRTAIFELIPMTTAIRDLVLQRPSTRQIWALAVQEGAQSMFNDGLEKVLNGKTTLEELIRVAPPS